MLIHIDIWYNNYVARVAPESPKAYRIATNNFLGNTERQGEIYV